jgi:hypothetical protein
MRNIILGLLFVSCLSGASDFSVTTGAWSYHFEKNDYITNENNNLFAINYKDWSVGGFNNSYGNDTYFVARNFDLAQFGDFKISLITGVDYGYTNCQGGINESTNKVICPFLSSALTYTRYEIQPSLAVLSTNAIGGAITFKF